MTDLAERIEAATGPDRELDAEIALALGIVRERDGDCFYGHKDYSMIVMERGYYDHEGNAPELPHYTASIDAAMMLTEPWMDADDIANLFAHTIRACKAAKCDPRKDLARYLAAAAIRAGAK